MNQYTIFLFNDHRDIIIVYDKYNLYIDTYISDGGLYSQYSFYFITKFLFSDVMTSTNIEFRHYNLILDDENSSKWIRKNKIKRLHHESYTIHYDVKKYINKNYLSYRHINYSLLIHKYIKLLNNNATDAGKYYYKKYDSQNHNIISYKQILLMNNYKIISSFIY